VGRYLRSERSPEGLSPRLYLSKTFFPVLIQPPPTSLGATLDLDGGYAAWSAVVPRQPLVGWSMRHRWRRRMRLKSPARTWFDPVALGYRISHTGPCRITRVSHGRHAVRPSTRTAQMAGTERLTTATRRLRSCGSCDAATESKRFGQRVLDLAPSPW